MQSKKSQKPSNREIELDFIRGIAILMVLDFHSPRGILLSPFRWLGFENFGWAGVDIFFVLSGFLVGGLLIKEWKVRGGIDSKQFLIRRGFKIWPQYYAFLLLMLITGHRNLKELWGNLLNIQNYVGGIAHTWTLAVEEHAYILLVVCLGIAARLKTRMRSLFLFFCSVAVGVVGLRLSLAHRGYNTFTRTDTRIDGILYGVMLAILYHYAPDVFQRLQKHKWAWVLIVLTALAWFRFAPPGAWGPPLSWFCADAMGVAFLKLLYRHREGIRRPALYRFIAWIGLYSYGIYLWHVSVVGPAKTLEGRLPLQLRPAWDAIAAPVFGVMVGILFTKLVEFPALKMRERLFPRRVDSAVGIPAEAEERAFLLADSGRNF